jgi:hypothetical protein
MAATDDGPLPWVSGRTIGSVLKQTTLAGSDRDALLCGVAFFGVSALVRCPNPNFETIAPRAKANSATTSTARFWGTANECFITNHSVLLDPQSGKPQGASALPRHRADLFCLARFQRLYFYRQ